MGSQRGFTLVEIVVAFVLLSLVLVSSFELFTSGMRRAGNLDERSQALAVAQSQLALAGMEIPLKEGQHAGQTEDGRYRWTLAITRFEEAAQQPNQPLLSAYGLYRVETVVSWTGADGRAQSISLATLELGSIL
jgi:general secretion pathway protein I